MYIKGFSIFKVKEKKNDKSPDYEMSINIGSKEQPQYITVAGLWLKEGQNGIKFMSGKFSGAYGDRKEYAITEVVDVNVPKFDRDSRGKPVGERVVEEINPEDIPF